MTGGGTQNEMGGTAIEPAAQFDDLHPDGPVVEQLKAAWEGLAATRRERDQFFKVTALLLAIIESLKADLTQAQHERTNLRTRLNRANERQADILRQLQVMDRRVDDLDAQLTRSNQQLGQAHQRIEETNRLMHVLTDRARALEARIGAEFPSSSGSESSVERSPDTTIPIARYRAALDSTGDVLQSGSRRLARLRKQYAEPSEISHTVGVTPAMRVGSRIEPRVGRPVQSVWVVSLVVLIVGVIAFGIYGIVTLPGLQYASGDRPDTEYSTCSVRGCTPVLMRYKWNLSGDSGVTTNFTANRTDLRSLTGTLTIDPDQCRGAQVDWSVLADGRTLSSGRLSAERPSANLDVPLADNTQQITFQASAAACEVVWDRPAVHADHVIRPL